MNIIVPVFQFEVRYNHILNFSQIARKILAPFVKLTQSIKIENQNTLNERYILNFEEENYFIIISWDRILIKGQGNLKSYTTKNSPIQVPFFIILDKLRELEEFGSIQNILFAITYIKELKIAEEDLYRRFTDIYFNSGTKDIFERANDMAVTLEEKKIDSETSISFGPYKGKSELERRPVGPVNINNLENTEFRGLMFEYKYAYTKNEVYFEDFIEITKSSNKLFEKVWKML